MENNHECQKSLITSEVQFNEVGDGGGALVFQGQPSGRWYVVGLVSWGLAGVPGRSRESRDGSDRGPAGLREGQVTHLAQQGQTAPFPLFGVGRRLVSVCLARSPSPLGRSVVVSLIEREEKTVHLVMEHMLKEICRVHRFEYLEFIKRKK